MAEFILYTILYTFITVTSVSLLAFVVTELTAESSVAETPYVVNSSTAILYTGKEYVLYNPKHDFIVTEKFESVATSQFIFSGDYIVLGEL